MKSLWDIFRNLESVFIMKEHRSNLVCIDCFYVCGRLVKFYTFSASSRKQTRTILSNIRFGNKLWSKN